MDVLLFSKYAVEDGYDFVTPMYVGRLAKLEHIGKHPILEGDFTYLGCDGKPLHDPDSGDVYIHTSLFADLYIIVPQTGWHQ